MHMVPSDGPNSWERPDKLAEPSYWKLREAEGAPSCSDTGGDCGRGERDLPAWKLYVGIPKDVYGNALRLSRTMTVDHCQYSYDAALSQIVQQMKGAT